MNSRARAITILQQAREILSERMTQRLVESEQEIMDDAQGLSYLSEIETIYEQLGSRLAHVNAILSTLPPLEEASPGEVPASEPICTDLASTYSPEDLGESADELPLALPAPGGMEQRTPAPAYATMFQAFAAHIQRDELEEAGAALAELLGIDRSRARSCADVFAERSASHPNLVLKVMQLRLDLITGNTKDSTAILAECFGLQDVESLQALESLRSRISSASDVRVN